MQRTGGGGRRSRAAAPAGGSPRQEDAAAADLALGRDAAELYQALTALIRVYQFRDKDGVCHEDISVSQCYALKSLAARPGLMLHDLARDLRLDKSTTSRVVADLERKGYARRSPHPDDSRAVRIEPTASGRRLLDRIERGLIAEQKALLAGFSPAARRDLTRLLALLARTAAERTSPPCATEAAEPPEPRPRSRRRAVVPGG